MKDRLFIFITIILVVLFVASVLENILFSTSLEEYSGTILFERAKRVENDTSGILIELEQTGLQPREADYYQVVDE